jgi:hypothetical protein
MSDGAITRALNQVDTQQRHLDVDKCTTISYLLAVVVRQWWTLETPDDMNMACNGDIVKMETTPLRNNMTQSTTQ